MVEPGAAEEALDEASRAEFGPVLAALGLDPAGARARFTDPRFDKRYDVVRVETCDGPVVVKKDEGDHRCYTDFLDARPELPVAHRLATAEVDGVRWHVFAYAGARDLQVLDEARAGAAGAALARLHAAFWVDSGPLPADAEHRLADRQWRFDLARREHPNWEPALAELERRSRTAPHTFCHGDLLPMNVLWDGRATTLIDFGAGGVRPYFGDPARFVVFGGPDAPFVQPEGCRTAFLSHYLAGIRAATGTGLTDADFAHDLALGELYEYLCVFSGTLRAEQRDPEFQRGASFDADVAELGRLAALVV